jgi:nucleotide-binding universal stress UspA family protein
VETVYKILQKLGVADLETIVDEAQKAGIPPPVATTHVMRLVEKKRVKVICDVAVRYSPT